MRGVFAPTSSGTRVLLVLTLVSPFSVVANTCTAPASLLTLGTNTPTWNFGGSSSCSVTTPAANACTALCRTGHYLASGSLTSTVCVSNGQALTWATVPNCQPRVCTAPQILLAAVNVQSWSTNGGTGACTATYPTTNCVASCATSYCLSSGSLQTTQCLANGATLAWQAGILAIDSSD